MSTSRREFFRGSLKLFSGVVAGSSFLSLITRRTEARAFVHRPPGALPEDKFGGSCSRCGLCASACPYESIKLMSLFEGANAGTPAIEARKVPCYMCVDMPCIQACPTGALDPNLSDIKDSKMGVAALVDRDKCLALTGNRCEVCFNACPLRRDALKIVPRVLNVADTSGEPSEQINGYSYFEPTVNPEACTGCGLCEHACPLDTPAIQVFSRNRFAVSKEATT